MIVKHPGTAGPRIDPSPPSKSSVGLPLLSAIRGAERNMVTARNWQALGAEYEASEMVELMTWKD